MDVSAIEIFVRVGDTGSFSGAATTLGITTSGVSKAITRLEGRLNTQLLIRSTRRVRLTVHGEAFHARCRAVLIELHDAERALRDGNDAPRGLLRVTAPLAYGKRCVLPALLRFGERHRDVQMQTVLTDRMLNLVDDKLDLAVRIGPLADSGLMATRLGETRFVVCASPGYLAEKGQPTHPDDLNRYRCVNFIPPSTPKPLPWQFIIEGTSELRHVEGRMALDDGDAIVEAGIAGAGLIRVQDYLVRNALTRGDLVVALDAFAPPAVPISLVYPPTRFVSPALRALIDHLRVEATHCD